MNTLHDKWLIWHALANTFAADLTRYIVPRVPLQDGLGRKRFIDMAIISRTANTPKVAILIRPAAKDRSPDTQKELDMMIGLLSQQHWVTAVFSPEEMLYQFEEVQEHLQTLVYGKTQKSFYKYSKPASHHTLQTFLEQKTKKLA